MANHDTVQPNPQQVKEFVAAVIATLPEMTADQMQYWIRRKGRKGQLAKVLAEGLAPSGSTLADWERFLDKYFGKKLDISGLVVPEHKSGFDRIIVVPSGLTLNGIVEVCRSKFPVYTYRDDLDRDVSTNDRMPVSSYAIRVRDRVEADEELKELSAEVLETRGITGITLGEHLLFVLKYYDETGKHLDSQNWTLCSGSRYSGGGVPRVAWRGGELYVAWCSPRSAHSRLRAREVVS